MNPTPEGWPRITSSLFYDDAPAAIDWLCRAFGFEVRLKIEGDAGVIEHSELTFGSDGLIMVSSASRKQEQRLLSPQTLGGATQSCMVYLDDVDAACERARAVGAQVTYEPKTTDYGEDYWSDRSCGVTDLEGHRWWLVQRVRNPGKK
jgi:uncharacterized glyoxalase superfamily protein PhnB